MPNHITNVLKVEHEDQSVIQSVVKQILDDQGYFSFEKIIPMPKILKGTSSPNRRNADECIAKTGYPDWYSWTNANWDTKWNAYGQSAPYETVQFKPWHITSRSFPLRQTQRCYPHRINKKRFKRWLSENELAVQIRFETAWGAPFRIYEALSRKFPEVTFAVEYADEDTGSNCGYFKLKGGKCVEETIAKPWRDQSKEERRQWTKFAFELTNPGCCPKEYGYDENWDYIEE